MLQIAVSIMKPILLSLTTTKSGLRNVDPWGTLGSWVTSIVVLEKIVSERVVEEVMAVNACSIATGAFL